MGKNIFSSVSCLSYASNELQIQTAVINMTSTLPVSMNKDYVGLAHFSDNSAKSGVLFKINYYTQAYINSQIMGLNYDIGIVGITNLKQSVGCIRSNLTKSIFFFNFQSFYRRKNTVRQRRAKNASA